MGDAIFLSASIPDAKREKRYAETADTVAITAAVSALSYVTLGRRPLIWGGHPAITPMIWAAAEEFELNYGSWVKLYQSRYFKDEFPEDNERFENVTYVDAVGSDLNKSLQAMRERMFTDQNFSAGVFIGGMGGIIDEFEMLRQLQPDAKAIPIISTGGAVLDLASRLQFTEPDLADDLEYVGLFHRKLNISVKETRYLRPEDQPPNVADRLWRP
jgi:hypothetical protein